MFIFSVLVLQKRLTRSETDELDVTLVNIMEKVINDEDLEPGEGIIHHEEAISH